MSDSTEFKVGDVAMLKSGGPLMTITQVGPKEGDPRQYHCVWFVEGKAGEGAFPGAALVKSEVPRL